MKLVREAIKCKPTYNDQGIAFDEEGRWNFYNELVRNVVIFGVDNSSLSRTYNRKNNFLVLGEGLTQGVNGSTDAAEKNISINFSKANAKFCLSLYYNADESYLNVNKT